MWANYSDDQIKLEEKSNKYSFKALPVKIQQSKNRQGVGQNVPPPGQLGLSKELISVTWYPDRSWDWYMSEDAKKEVGSMFIEEL